MDIGTDSAAAAAETLPAIPVHDLTAAADPALALMEAEAGRLRALVGRARHHYGAAVVENADALSRRWLARSASPYAAEIARIARHFGAPGAYFLNTSFEWSCTCAVAADPAAPGMRMLRVLDWPLEGLGANLVAVRRRGPAGTYLNLAWPGFAGVVTALAPGRFAAALNQAPMQRYGLGRIGDWAANRLRVWCSRDIPPMHLLRHVFETCRDYGEARAALSRTPMAIAGIFLLCGPNPGEGCLIERTGHRVFVHEAPVCGANHWLTPRLAGRARGTLSHERQALMETIHRDAGEALDWIVPPVLNATTRLVACANPATGRLTAQGWENGARATRLLRLDG